MARRTRDYKAEYARRKANAARLGQTPWKLRQLVKRGEYVPIRHPPKRVLQRIAKESPDLQRMRRESAHWSIEHSRKATSEYSPSFTPSQVRAYHDSFVVYHPDHRERMQSLRYWLVDEMDYYTEDEYDDSDYYSDPI